ncbi:MAG: methyltransferase domain-containing protein [Puniceicoccales bacterium]
MGKPQKQKYSFYKKAALLACLRGRTTLYEMRNWEQCYAEQNTPWDHGEPAPPLREYLRHTSITGNVLVPGCGKGHDVRLLAAQGATVLGLDIAPSAIHEADSIPKAANERYEVGDLLALSDSLQGTFDWAVEHTCLCALDPEQREAYAEAVFKALKADGYLLGIFYCIIEGYDGSGPPHPISPDAIDALFADKFETVSAWTPTETYTSRQGGKEQMRLMRKIG